MRGLLRGKSRTRLLLLGLSAAIIGAGIALALTREAKPTKNLSYERFRRALSEEDVRSVVINKDGSSLTGELRDGTAYESTFLSEASLDDLLARHPDVRQTVVTDETSAWEIAFVVILFGAIALFVFRMSRGQHGWMASFGRAQAGTGHQEPRITFADVAGAEEAVEELDEIKEFLSDPRRFERLGARIPRGVLLFGPPGSGKTLLARAVAGEASVAFLSISGSDFVEMLVGVGAARVRNLFEQAKESAPAIIFVDEIDAVGRHRGAGLGQGHDEREQTLNQLLVEMDGFDQTKAVVIIAATNRPDILDPALLRPGRFDRHIMIDRPDMQARVRILEVHARGKPFAEDVEFGVVARRTPGFTGADLANVLNEAALLTARLKEDTIRMQSVEEAIDRVLAGPARTSRIISPDEKRVIAYHEAGHALVAWVAPTTDTVDRVSIISRGRALGHMLKLPAEERFLVRRSEMVDELAVMLGGRVAEVLTFADPTSGAQDDLQRATKLARQMVCEFGMSEKVGLMAIGPPVDQPFLGREMAGSTQPSELIRNDIDIEVRRLLDHAHDQARAVLTGLRPQLERLVEALIDRETLKRSDLESLLQDVSKGDLMATGSLGPSSE